jgi:hypothetical protein
MEEKLFTKIMVEIKGGVMVNITDLPKEHYEEFLELMHKLRLAYITITSR